MYRYSMTQWIVGDEEIEYSFQRLKKYGYDGIEFAAESALLDKKASSELASAIFSLEISVIR